MKVIETFLDFLFSIGLYTAMGEIQPGSQFDHPKPATNSKKLKEILTELERPEKRKIRESLGDEFSRAKEVEKKLTREARIRALNLDSSVFKSLRLIVKPPKQVHEVVISFLLLIGEYEGLTRVFILTLY